MLSIFLKMRPLVLLLFSVWSRRGMLLLCMNFIKFQRNLKPPFLHPPKSYVLSLDLRVSCSILLRINLPFPVLKAHTWMMSFWEHRCSGLMIRIFRITPMLSPLLDICLSVQFSSFAQSCLTLCDSMNHSMPGLPVYHQFPEFTQTHVHPTISSSVEPFPSCPQSFPASGSFPMNQLFTSGGQSIGVSASTSVLPVNTQDWSPLGWDWLDLLAVQGTLKSSPTPQFKRINSLALSFLHSSTLTSIHYYWKNHSLD